MAEEDDEFEMLCKSFEGTERPEVAACIGSKDTSEILDEIDSFLEEDGKNCNLENKCSKKSQNSFSDANITSCVSLSDDSAVISNETQNLSCVNSPSEIPSTPPDPLAKHYSEIAPILENLPEDQSRPVEQITTCDGLDLSLLDREEWEEEWEMREFTMSDILGELKEELLDSDDEDIDEPINDTSETGNASSNVSETRNLKKEFESLESRSKVTEERYYQQLEDVWKKYKDYEGVGPVPARSQMTRPRIFKDISGTIVGYETLQEYVDNNHPMWGPHRELFNQFLFKEKSHLDLVKFVSKNWGDQAVNTARNLTVYRRGGGVGNIYKVRHEGLSDKHIEKFVTFKEDMKSAKATLVEMYANSSNADGVQENERARAKLFDAQLKEKLIEQVNKKNEISATTVVESSEADVRNCDLCESVCLCIVGKKRGAEDVDEGERVSKKQFLDTVEAWRTEDKWGQERIAEAMFGVLEAFELQSCYSDKPYFTKAQMSELTSLEDVHNMILDRYASPYKTDKEETIGWMNQEDLENF